jgi:hypothetical protein
VQRRRRLRLELRRLGLGRLPDAELDGGQRALELLFCLGASSKIDHETGIVTITTPGAGSNVGDRLYVVGSGASWGIGCSDWLLRLVTPHPSVGRANFEGIDPRPAAEAMLEQLRSRELHPSLVAEPPT